MSRLRPGVSTSAPPVRRGWRIAAGVASGAVLLSSGVAWAGVSKLDGSVERISVGGLTAAIDTPDHTAPMTMLVVASDSREGITRAQAAQLHLGTADYGKPRTDTMMLVHIGADASNVTVVSLPRDTLVTLPAYVDDKGKRHNSKKAKLNAAYEVGGATMMVEVVESMTGVPINHYAEINFNGFLQMVDAVDGVEVCVPKAVKDKNSGLDLPAGRQTVQGPQALAYVRARYIDPTADLGRMQRQQKFVASLVKKATSTGTLLNPVRLSAFLDGAAGSITLDSGLDRDQVLALADRLKGTNPGNIAFLTVPLAGDARVDGVGAVLKWDTEKAKALFTAIKNDKPVVAPAAAAAAPTVTVAPGSVRVKVLNGTGTTGLGGKAANDLAAVGFAITGPAANAPQQVGATTVITYDPRYDESVKTVQAALPGAELVSVKGLGRTIQVTVGTSYAGATKVVVAKKASTTTAAAGGVTARTAAQDICSS